jgi:hypothetical protein
VRTKLFATLSEIPGIAGVAKAKGDEDVDESGNGDISSGNGSTCERTDPGPGFV